MVERQPIRALASCTSSYIGSILSPRRLLVIGISNRRSKRRNSCFEKRRG